MLRLVCANYTLIGDLSLVLQQVDFIGQLNDDVILGFHSLPVHGELLLKVAFCSFQFPVGERIKIHCVNCNHYSM